MLRFEQVGRSPAQRWPQAWFIGITVAFWALMSPLAYSGIRLQSPELLQVLDQPWRIPNSDQTWGERRAAAKAASAIKDGDQLSDDRAAKILSKALQEAEAKPLNGARISILYRLATLQGAQRRENQSIRYLTDAAALASETYGPSSPQHAVCKAALAYFQARANDFASSSEGIQSVLETYDRVFGPDHAVTVDAEEALAPALIFSDPGFAAKRLKHALSAHEGTEANDPKDMFALYYHLSDASLVNKDFPSAVRFAELADGFTKKVEIESEHRGVNDLVWAEALTALDRTLEAEPHLQNAREKLSGPQFQEELGRAAFALAIRFDNQGLSDKAVTHAEQSRALFTSAHVPPASLADNEDLLASVYDKLGQGERAREALRERIRLDPSAAFSPAYASSTFERVIRSAIDRGEFSGCEELIDYALKLRPHQSPPEETNRLSWLLREQGRLRLSRGDADGAIESLTKAEEIYRLLPRGHSSRLTNEVLLGTALALVGEDEEAYRVLSYAMFGYRATVPHTAWQADSSLSLAEVAARQLTNVRDVTSIYRWSCDVYVDIGGWEGATDCIERLARYLRGKQRYAELESILREYLPQLGVDLSTSSRALLDFWFARTLEDRRLAGDAEPYRRKLRTRCERTPDLASLCNELLADATRANCERCQARPFVPDLQRKIWN